MLYRMTQQDGADRTFQFEKQRFLCFSGKALDTSKVIGVADLSGKRKGEDALALGKGEVPVMPPCKKGLLQKTVGYVPVEGGGCIEVRQSQAMFLGLLAPMVASVAAAGILLVSLPPKVAEPLMNPLPPVDTNVTAYVGKAEEQAQPKVPRGGGSMSISYTASAKLHLSTGELEMDYQNPPNSTHDAVLSLYIVTVDEQGEEAETLVAQSGRIPAGSSLNRMDLQLAREFLSEGRYNARYNVGLYDPETGEKAIAEPVLDQITLIVLDE